MLIYGPVFLLNGTTVDYVERLFLLYVISQAP